jgi:flagellar basal body rod protein FlgG
MQSVWTSLSGMQASQAWLKTIGNNIANQSTTGYATNEASFADTYTKLLQGSATGPTIASRYTPLGWGGGTGTFAQGIQSNFNGMSTTQTGNPTDLAIQGNGFFVVEGQNGTPLYTKAGNFIWSKAANGNMVLATAQGRPVLDVNGHPIVQQPGEFAVGQDGQVSYGQGAAGGVAQRIAIAQVGIPSQTLAPVGDGLYQLTNGGKATVANRNGSPIGVSILQGSLNTSNVSLTKEMTDMLQAQTMYQLNAQAQSVNNKMMQAANALGTGL